MPQAALTTGKSVVIRKQELDALLADLRTDGFQTIGPRLQDESIIYKDIEGLKDLPLGITSAQAPGSYRLIRSGKDRYFDFIPAAQSWKQFLFPPRQPLFSASKEKTWNLVENKETTPRYAVVGMRACEISAIAIQDKVLFRSDFYDPIYRARREALFIIAVNCLDPNATCFCASMGTGPKVTSGFDLCLTELDDVFLVEIGSELGRSFLSSRKYSLPSAFVQSAAVTAMNKASESIVRTMDTHDLPELLTSSLEAEHWTNVAKRCLSCTSCTLVCPTCFCWDIIDEVDILRQKTQRIRVWDSCFNPNFSHVFGGNTRPNIRSRYRQWLVHKLGTWVDQFGVLGCVGCGRCITWCPAKIDITEEVAAIRAEVKR